MISNHEKPDQFRYAVIWPLIFVLLLWVVAYLQWRFKLDMHNFALFPRKWQNLHGTITTLFIHGDFEHLFSNSGPLVVLGTGVFYFFADVKWRITLFLSIFTGLLIWIFARPSYHIGASGMVYALASFLFFSGIFKKHKAMMAVSLLIVAFYGSMVWGVLPGEEGISWEAHLFGAITGVAAAFIFRRHGPSPPPPPQWMNDSDENDEKQLPHISHYKKMPLEE